MEILLRGSVWIACIALFVSVKAYASESPGNIALVPASDIVPFNVSYGSFPQSSVDAIVINNDCYVNIADLAEYVGGSITLHANSVEFTLTGKSTNTVSFETDNVYRVDSLAYIRTTLIDSLAGITLSVDMLDLSIRIVSTRPLALDLLRRQQLVRLQRRAGAIDGDPGAADIISTPPSLLGGGHLFYRFSTVGSHHGQWSAVNFSPQLQIVGGVLSVEYERRFSDFSSSQQFLSGQWSYQRPELTWLTEVSLGTTVVRGLSRGNWLTARARNTSLSWKPKYGYDDVVVHLDDGWDADVLLDGRVIGSAPSNASTTYGVPLHGGQTTVVVDAYDAQGNNRSTEYRYRMHNESVPSNTLWYDAAVARSLSSTSIEAVANVGYGVNTWLTLGSLTHARLDVLQWVPELYAHARLARAQLVSLRYAPGQMGRVEMSILPYNNASIDVAYTRWLTDNVDTLMTRRPLFNALRDDLLARCFLPFSIATINSYVALAGWTRQGGVRNGVGGTLQVGAATSILNTYARLRYDLSEGRSSKYVDLNAFLQLPVPGFAQSLLAGCALRAFVDVNLDSREFTTTSIEMQASTISFMDMQLLGAVRYDVVTKQTFTTIRLQAQLPFIRADASTTMSGGNRITDMSLSGSVVMSGSNRDLDFYQYQRSRTGSINVIVFEDNNQNNHLDDGEPIVSDIAVRCVGGDVQHLPGGRILVAGLFPNSQYSIVVDPTSLPDRELFLSKASYTVLASPHQQVELTIPLQRGASIDGRVISSRRVNVLLVDDNGDTTKTSTFRDGTFTFGGLRPGSYELHAVVNSKRVTSRIVIDNQRKLQGSTELRP